MLQSIKGQPGSQGIAKGVARVILSLDELNRFKQGEILVTSVTSPSWTPVIHSASAVVTDIGGSLSHAAIVCREYGIPAVVGTKVGTKTIKDSQLVEVNGTTGTISILG